MSKKDELRLKRLDTIINHKSKSQDKNLEVAVGLVIAELQKRFPGLKTSHARDWKIRDVVGRLKKSNPDVDFHYFFESSAMRPDGGVLSIVNKNGDIFPILIAEKKNQGTNDARAKEGKAKQAKGNAIERLGKNVIGFRTAMKGEAIFPFVCFGDGCDFATDSSIPDRVVTIAQFGRLNVEHLHKQGANNEFDRGSFYFREEEWSTQEMTEMSLSIAERSVYYYFSKYGKHSFL